MVVTTEEIGEALMKRIDEIWKCSAEEVVKEHSPPVNFCGICTEKMKDGYFIHQKPYIKDLLKEHRLEDCNATKIILDKDSEEGEKNLEEEETEELIIWKESPEFLEKVREAQKLKGEVELTRKGCIIKAFKSTSHTSVTTQGLRSQQQEESAEVRMRRLRIRENGIKQEYLEAKARGEEFTSEELHEVITELIQVGNELAKTENEVSIATQEAVDKKVLELDMQHEVSRQEYLDNGTSEEGIKLMDHLNFMEVTLKWTTEQMTVFRDAYLEEKQLRRSEVTVSSKETRVVVKAFRAHQRVQSTSRGSRDPPSPVEEVEELIPTVTGIQEALDARLAELKTLEVDLKQEYEDLKKVCNPIQKKTFIVSCLDF
jgi:hypothetical protein